MTIMILGFPRRNPDLVALPLHRSSRRRPAFPRRQQQPQSPPQLSRQQPCAVPNALWPQQLLIGVLPSKLGVNPCLCEVSIARCSPDRSFLIAFITCCVVASSTSCSSPSASRTSSALTVFRPASMARSCALEGRPVSEKADTREEVYELTQRLREDGQFRVLFFRFFPLLRTHSNS